MFLDHRSHPVKTEIKVGNLNFGLNLISLYDANKTFIGNSVEWTDLNDRATYTREVERVIGAAKSGNLKY
ncbi:MAG: hypothetical protein HQ464_03050, partial [Planctomycetes bacterium]|nr:hypothetical protein [Planctomycetota bacterium]